MDIIEANECLCATYGHPEKGAFFERTVGRQEGEDWTAEELARTEEYEQQEAYEVDGVEEAVEDNDEVIPDISDDSEGEENQEDEENDIQIVIQVSISLHPLLFATSRICLLIYIQAYLEHTGAPGCSNIKYILEWI